VRCRRESKECFFSATRRKRKTDDGLDVDGYPADEYVIRNGRKRLFTGDPSPPAALDRRLYSEVPLIPSGQIRREPLRRPEGPRSTTSTGHGSTSSRHSDFGAGTGDDSNAQLENIEAQTVMRRGVYGPHDALDLLYKAATDGFVCLHPRPSPCSPDAFRAGAHGSLTCLLPTSSPLTSSDPKINGPTITTTSIPPPPTTHTDSTPRQNVRDSRSVDERNVKMEAAIDPALTKKNLSSEPGYASAIKAWNRFRFVRAGWFSAQEAIEYID